MLCCKDMSDPHYNRSLIPRPKVKKKKNFKTPLTGAILGLGLFTLVLFSFPSILAHDLEVEQAKINIERAFPVTVFPKHKTIVENPAVEAFLTTSPVSGLSATAVQAGNIFTWLAIRISELSAYKQVAGIAGIDSLFITIYPGYREEQVANAFGAVLNWTPSQKKAFLKDAHALQPELLEGIFVPGTYFVGVTDPAEVATITDERFKKEILARYGTTTQAQVPLEDALTIASLLEREAGDWEDMRLISGVIWNRLFVGMNLQIDATLQYAKAEKKLGTAGKYWEKVVPKDKYIKSTYNTYQNDGLPPGPISNSSIAAVLAALNPKKTDCLFYFHDKYGRFHCSPTYEGHVKLLKEQYGQGK